MRAAHRRNITKLYRRLRILTPQRLTPQRLILLGLLHSRRLMSIVRAKNITRTHTIAPRRRRA